MRVLAMLVLAGALAAADPVLPAAWRVDLRSELAGAAPVLAEARGELVLDLPFPEDATILRLGVARFAPALSDAGERLALLPAPGARRRDGRLDRRSIATRSARLPLWVGAGWRPAQALTAVHGTVAATVGLGAASRCDLPAAPEAAVELPGIADGGVRVEILGPTSFRLAVAAGAAARLASVDAFDAEGRAIELRARGTLEAEWDAPARPVVLALRWWPVLGERTLAVDLARIELPGGLPGRADAALPAPFKRAPPAGAPPWWAAIASGDRAGIDAALAAGGDPAVECGEAGSAWEYARDLRRFDVLHRLLGNPWP